MKDNLLETKSNHKAELSGFQWEDPLLFENSINPNERMLRDAARAFSLERLKPRIVEDYDKMKVFDMSIIIGKDFKDLISYDKASIHYPIF